jgi:hypothetical protein
MCSFEYNVICNNRGYEIKNIYKYKIIPYLNWGIEFIISINNKIKINK